VTSGLPPFVRANPSLVAAFDLARMLNERRGDGDLDRALRVALIMHEAGYDEDVVAAALLQTVAWEDETELEEVEAVCGREVSDLVATVIDDRRIGSYERRKAEQRDRIARSDRIAAAIYAADQLTGIRSFAAAGQLPPRVEFRHYQRVARVLDAAFPDLPFVAEMRFELAGLTGRPRRGRS
jgi:(p)ppGpp synthase/HD superfamily hydrolase